LPRLPRQARIFSDLDAEMKRIMQNAVDHVYQVLLLKENDPETYQEGKNNLHPGCVAVAKNREVPPLSARDRMTAI